MRSCNHLENNIKENETLNKNYVKKIINDYKKDLEDKLLNNTP